MEIADSTILKAKVTPVTTVVLRGTTDGTGQAGIAVAHLGSNNMIAFRYRLKDVPMFAVKWNDQGVGPTRAVTSPSVRP